MRRFHFCNYHSSFIRSPQIAEATDTNRAYLAHAQLLGEMRVVLAGINGLGEALSTLHLSTTPPETTQVTASAAEEMVVADEVITDDPITFNELMNQEKKDRRKANADKNILKFYCGKWHLSPRIIAFENLNAPQLWELWYNGNKADSNDPIPPYRHLLDSDFVCNSSCRKAKGLMERLHFIIAENELVKQSVPITTMKLSDLTNLGNQAIRALYSRAVEKAKETNKPIKLKKDIMSISFSTFFDRVSPFIKLPEEPYEAKFLSKTNKKKRKLQ